VYSVFTSSPETPLGRPVSKLSNGPTSLDFKTPGVVPPPALFLAALCLGLAVQYFKPQALLAHAPIGYATGGAVIVLGLALVTWVVLHFRRAGTPVSPLRPAHHLVVSGPYRFSRNPDYIGQALLYIGIGLVLNSAWVLLGLLPALLLIRYLVIAKEERYLESRFGAEYVRYCQCVRRWF
jgi:protein-S-isoprenylcysteine O-methyltransferase Ste14